MQPTQEPSDTGITEVTPAVILRGAARYLQLHGWIQGLLYADDPSLTPAACGLGAIGMAAFGRRLPTYEDVPAPAEWRDYNRACDALDDYLNLTGAKAAAFLDDIDHWADETTDGAEVNDWNDEIGRTADEVIAALNAAADQWDNTHVAGGAR
jgi:hypothetical protein